MAFSLKAVFGIDSSGVRTELKQLRREFGSFVQDMGRLGIGVAVGAFVALSKGALDLAAQLKDTALQIGINVEALQALRYAATQNGSSADSMNKALEKLRLNVQGAKEGNEEYTRAITTLGLTTQQLLALPLEKQYEAVAKAYASAKDKGAAYNAVAGLFGSRIGPDQIAVLESLARDGFPKSAAAAKAAGQVMSAETITALEKASQAIDDFKTKATVAIGNIIVNFRSEEGLKLLGMQLARAAGVFGARIVDAFDEVNQFVGAVLTGTFLGVANKFRDFLVDSLSFWAQQVNKILPKSMEIDVASIQNFKSAGLTVGETITQAIANTKPGTFTKDVAAYWDKAIAAQKVIVADLNKVDLGKDAKLLKDAGKTIEDGAARALAEAAEKARQAGLTVGEALADGAVKWADAQARWSANIDKSLRAWKEIGVLIAGIRGGSTFNDLSPEALAEVVRQNRAEADRLRNPALNRFAGDIGSNIEAGRLEAEALNAQSQLDVRNRFSRAINLKGVEGARRDFDPVIFEKLLRDFGPTAEQQKTNNLLEDLLESNKAGFSALSKSIFYAPKAKG